MKSHPANSPAPARETVPAIHIALPSDESYVPGLTVTAASIALYADPATPLHFHILDGGIQPPTFERFSACIRRVHPRVQFTRHRVDEGDFASLPLWSGNRMTYARLMLPRAMPDEAFVIYSDTDMLWLAPVEGLWALRDPEKVALVVRDGYPQTETREVAWFARHDLPFQPENYFCAGLLLLNLKRMREEQIVKQTFDFIAAHPDCQFADQTAFNVLLHDRVEHLPQAWQVLTRLARKADFDHPVVLHYGGDIPWKRINWRDLLSDPVILWHHFNDQVVLGKRGASLARFLSPWQRFYKRALFLALHNSLVKRTIDTLCRTTARGRCCRTFDATASWIGRRRRQQFQREWKLRLAGR